MRQLTHKTMPSFLSQLKNKFENHTLTVEITQGKVISGQRLQRVSGIKKVGKLREITIEIGVTKGASIIQSFVSYFEDDSGEPLENTLQTMRVTYQFKSDLLLVFFDHLSPQSFTQHAEFMIKIEN